MPQEFGTAFDQPLPDEQRDALIDAMARKVVGKRMEMMTVFLLEAHRPFSFMASQALLVAGPFLGAFLGFGRVNRWSHVLEDRANVERLLQRIEELVDERDASAAPRGGEAAA